jgi:phage terminase large subunit-like protein
LERDDLHHGKNTSTSKEQDRLGEGGILKRSVSAVTKRWIKNASDEFAVSKQGGSCWFDEERANHAVDWIQDYCCLYEGVPAGTPMVLGDWQLDATLRMFGWVWESPDWGLIRRFRRAGIWLPKKGGKSPTLAAWGLYLFVGDGEPGQKIYSAARDGKQAMIAHRHAMAMVEMSPALNSKMGGRCTVNKNDGKIWDEETRSLYLVLAGDNFKSTEGINGSVLIDETHVVDRRLANVVRYAGASRREPLHIEVSTAGNDPDGYGREQYELGKNIEAGVERVPSFLFIAHEAPQTTTPEQLSDPTILLDLGKKANPAWGRLTKPSEFEDAYNSSKSSRATLLDFLMYRLNVWQASTNPWFSQDAWTKCEKKFAIEDLKGRECWAGLDLAQTRDLNALCLCFPEAEDNYKFLWWFWLPEETAKAVGHRVAFQQWALDPRCHLTLTPGSSVEHERIITTFLELSKTFVVKELIFDQRLAELPTRAMTEGFSFGGKTLFEGSGCPRSDFPQSLTAFAEPTKAFERLVLAGKLQHDGDPIMTWQIGHTKIRSDQNENCKPIKPGGPDDVRKIDGVIAGIMALAGAMRGKGTNEVSYWETHSLEFV